MITVLPQSAVSFAVTPLAAIPESPLMLELTLRFIRQIVPPVIATLVAAVLISAFNKTFSSHLQQPRLAALNSGSADAAPPAPPPATSVVAANKPAAQSANPTPQTGPVTEYITIEETTDGPEHIWDKQADAEAKDQSAIKTAAVTPPARPAPAPKPVTQPVVQAAPVAQPLPDPRRAAAPIEVAPVPRYVAPAPVVVSGPATMPPIVYEQPPMITAAPRPAPAPIDVDADDLPPRPPRGVLGTIVDTLKPSNLLERGRQLGDKIEAAGNEILPTIRH